MATTKKDTGRIKRPTAGRPTSSSSTQPRPPLSSPSVSSTKTTRIFSSRPQGRGFLRDNPRSSKFAFNKSYENRRGYYYKDAQGKWRTPDGRSAPGQKRVEITTRTGDRLTVAYRLRKAENYNERRHARLFRIDAINNVRALGIPITRKGFNRTAGKSRDPTIVRDRLHKYVQTQRSKLQPTEAPTFREARREFARKSNRLDTLDAQIAEAGGSGADPQLDQERLNLRRDVDELAEDLADFDEGIDFELDFEAWGDTP